MNYFYEAHETEYLEELEILVAYEFFATLEEAEKVSEK